MLARKMTPEEKQFLDLMKARATLRETGIPEYGYIIHSAQYVAVDGGTMACDKKWRIYINFEHFMSEKESIETSTSALFHEVEHLIRNHSTRFDQLHSGDMNRWNVASDAEINDSLFAERTVHVGNRRVERSLQQPLDGRIITSEKIGLPPNLTAEQYYEQLKGDEDQQDQDSSNEDGEGEESEGGAGQGHKCSGGSGVDGEWKSWEDQGGEIQPGVSEIEQEYAKRQIAEEILKSESSNPGSMPRDMVVWADAMLSPPKVRWDQQLRNEVRHAERISWIKEERTFARPSRREFVDRSMINPGRNSHLLNIAYVSDTSGSMSHLGDDVKSELNAIMRNPRHNVTAISADTDVASIKRRVKKLDDIDFVGGGGTDMRLPIQYLKESHRKERTDVLIIATDGGTPWPDPQPLPFSVIVLLVGIGGQSEWITSQIPHTYRVIVIDD